MMDTCEQARAWKKERHAQKAEARQNQSQMDKKWEQEAGSMYAIREYATQGMQDKFYSRKQFSAVKVKMYIRTAGKYVEESAGADTGAAKEIMAKCNQER